MIKKYESIIKVLTPLHTGGNEKTGSTPMLRVVFIHVNGKEIPLPYINGNSIRGKMRRIIMKDFFDNIEFNIEELPKNVYHSFFTGGVLEGGEDIEQVINLELRKLLRSYIPPISLFGCAYQNQMIVSKLKVSHAFPICLEYKDFLPENIQSDENAYRSIRTFTDEVFFTRRDDLKANKAEDEQAIQMKVDYEVFVPGTKFYHFFILEYPTEIELSCFSRMIQLMKEIPFLGARSSIGDGMIEFDYKVDISSDLYIEFLREHKNEIKEIIKGL